MKSEAMQMAPTDPRVTEVARSLASRLLDGLGCSQCATGEPKIVVVSPAGVVYICFGCTLRWFPGRTVAWLRKRLRPWGARQRGQRGAQHEQG